MPLCLLRVAPAGVWLWVIPVLYLLVLVCSPSKLWLHQRGAGLSSPTPWHPAWCLEEHGFTATVNDGLVYLIFFQGEELLKTSICTFLSVLSHLDIITENILEKVSINCL